MDSDYFHFRGYVGGGGAQELHSDMTFQFISTNEKGPSCGGNLCVNFVSCRFLYNEDYAVRPRK